MAFIRNAWYAACWSNEVSDGDIFHRTLLNEQIVFYRKRDGTLVGLLDRCPHRFVPLHLGKIQGDEIECSYHGLQFDCSGRCVKNPHGDGKIPDALKVRAYPVQERHGLVWIWMGDKPADAACIPDYGRLDSKDRHQMITGGYLHIEASYLLLAENLLDLSHLMFLHEGLLGNRDQANAENVVHEENGRIVCRRWMPHGSVPEIFDLLYRRDQQPVAMWTEFQWMAPGYLWFDGGVHAPELKEREENGWWYGQHLVTPETETSTHYLFAAVLAPGTRTDMGRFSELRRYAFVEQDKRMLEAQQAGIGIADFWAMKPTLLSVDAAPVRMRRTVERLVRAEQAEQRMQDAALA